MRERFSGSIIVLAMTAAAAINTGTTIRTSAQAPAPSVSAPGPAAALKTDPLQTPWGDPDLQGIWTDENDTPLQRPARYASQEFFTAAQRAELDEARTAVLANA